MEDTTATDGNVLQKFLERASDMLELVQGTEHRLPVEKQISLAMLGAQAHALQETLGISPYALILALRELADLGEEKLIAQGKGPTA